jgi:hypothetical protein
MKNLIILIIIAFAFISCEKKADTYKVTFEIHNAETITIEGDLGTVVSGAIVKLYKNKTTDNDKPDFEGTTDQNGLITFNVLISGEYIIVIEKDEMSNIIMQEIKNNLTIGYVINGVFMNQEEIDNSIQHGAAPFDIKFCDINADSILNNQDKAPGNYIDITTDSLCTFYIGNKNVPPII